MSHKEFRTILVILLSAGIAAVIAEKYLKPGLKGTFGI